jgi:hypothetical protein
MRAADRKLLLGLAGSLVLVFALVGANVGANHAPKPHEVPVGVIGTPREISAVEASLAHRAPGAYSVHAYTSAAAAETAIRHRVVYGAYRPGPPPQLLVASAASRSVATLLQQTFARGSVGVPPTVVHDLAPLPSSDPNGTTGFTMLVSLILAGELGAVLIFTLGQHRSGPQRLVVTIGMGLGAGLVATLVTNVVVGAFHGHFLGIWAVSALFVLAIAVPIAGFQALFGAGGTAIGAVLFLVIGNPASGGSSAPEMLPAFWREVSRALPPGAVVTALRDVVYFDGRGVSGALLVLGAWVIGGAAIVLAAYGLRKRATPASGPAGALPH